MRDRLTCWLTRTLLVASAVGALAAAAPAAPAAERVSATVFAGAGDIAPVMDQFRTALGDPDNGGDPGSHATGRREIDWDAVTDEFAAPNFLPADYFNAPAAPRARGAFLTTPGTGVQVSADAANAADAPVRFGHINPTYSSIFRTFSAERLFSPVGSNVVDLTFFVAGTQEPALVQGFGAVYTDVDRRKSSFKFFDSRNRVLRKAKVPVSSDGLSFLGVVFERPVIARVRIKYGTVALGPEERGRKDVAVMDNFIFGEPRPASSPE